MRLAALDSAEVLSRVRRVENTVEIDPDAPTLEEVREMIDEAVAEADETAGAERGGIAGGAGEGN